MRQLDNGWYIPDGDKKMTRHIESDSSPMNPGYENKQRDVVVKHHPSKKVFIDVGANVGVWSLSMLPHFEKVISYEPSVRNKECLEKNLNGKGEIRQLAVSDFNGVAEFHDEIKNCGNSKIWLEEKLPDLYDVKVCRLDDQKIIDCSLIKIDVQGYEWQVIQGAENLIKNYQPWIAFEVSADVDIICKFLEGYGYDMIDLKSKRMFIFAPKSGTNTPAASCFGRRMGMPPYTRLLPEDKQQIAAQRHG